MESILRGTFASFLVLDVEREVTIVPVAPPAISDHSWRAVPCPGLEGPPSHSLTISVVLTLSLSHLISRVTEARGAQKGSVAPRVTS